MRSLLLLIALASVSPAAKHFDLLITNAHIVDGAGNPWFTGDLGIRCDAIAAIGRLQSATAALRIDAKGLTVAPGFIDIHSHGRRGLFAVPTAENYLREGVTTIVEGPDGSSPLPLAPFFEKVERTGISVNYASFVGHGSIRTSVMGLVNRPATPGELEKMKALARTAMLDGAVGLSTGLFYVPGNYASTEEVIEIAKVVGTYGGFHQSHMRDETDRIVEAVRETIRIGEEGHLPTQITHHKIIGKANWGKSVETLELAESARARGIDVSIDQYPYTASSTGIAALFPQWSLEGGNQAVIERLNAPEARARIKKEIVHSIREGRGGGDAKNIVLVSCGFDKTLAGRSLADLTRDAKQAPSPENAAETAMSLQAKGGCSAVYHAIDDSDIDRILRSPYTMIASDGDIPVFGEEAPHPRSYGTFARILGLYVRERKVLTLPDAVRRMSSLPAQRLSFQDRGLLRPGMKADIVIFDPAQIADRATFDNPHQYSVGVRDVVVNGRLVLQNGQVTRERPGRVLYGPGHKK